MKRCLDWQIGWKYAAILGILIGMSLIIENSLAASYWLDENGTIWYDGSLIDANSTDGGIR